MEVFLLATFSEDNPIFAFRVHPRESGDAVDPNGGFQKGNRYRHRVRHIEIHARGGYQAESHRSGETGDERFRESFHE